MVSPVPEDELELLREAVSIDSPSGEEEAVSRHLVERMRAWGFRAERDAAGNAVGWIGETDEAAPAIALLGHIDTVPGRVPVRLPSLTTLRFSVPTKDFERVNWHV